MGSFMQDPDNEFNKLDALDKRLFFEILENREKELDAWIEYISKEYTAKGVRIDELRFKAEAKQFLEFVKKEDFEGMNNHLEN